MKVCLINNLYEPYVRGGAEVVVKLIADGLKKDGHAVFVITTKPIFKLKSVVKNLKVYYVGGFYYNLNKIPKVLRIFWHFFDMFDLGNYWKIKKILKQEKPDVVMTHNLKGVGYLIPYAIKKSGIKHIHTLHDIQLLHPSGLMFYEKEKNINALLAKIYQGLCKLLFSSSNIVISPSKWLLSLHTEKGFFENSKKVLLPNPTPTPRPTSPASELAGGRASLSPAFSSRERGTIFKYLYVGQIEEYKGILFLIRAFKLFCDEIGNRQCELLIVGDGSKFKKARKLIEQNENIKLLGRIKNEEVKKMMQEVDCLAMPSFCYENSPTVIYEAMSFGLPVIASKIGGVPELVGDNGLLFKPNNEGDLMYQMKWAIEHGDKLREIGRLGQKKIQEFNIKEYIKRILI